MAVLTASQLGKAWACLGCRAHRGSVHAESCPFHPNRPVEKADCSILVEVK